MNTLHLFAILLAGGIGTRFQSNLPKQYIKIKDKYLSEYSIIRFQNWFLKFKKINDIIPEKIIYVVPKDYLQLSKEYLKNYDLIYTIGGTTRHDSTKAGLIEIKKFKISLDNIIVYIHDVARPVFLEKELDEMLDFIINEHNKYGCISLASPVTETIVQNKNDSIITLDRRELYSIKTPQVLYGKYMDIFLNSETKNYYTDLITWANDFNIKTKLINSHQNNIKVTYPMDLKLVEYLLNTEEN